MKKMSLNDTQKGWFVGGFENVLYHADFEVGIKQYKAGDKEGLHFHLKSDELTVIVSGKVKMNNVIFEKNDIIIVEPGESTNFEALEDSITCVVRNKYFPNDKYICEEK